MLHTKYMEICPPVQEEKIFEGSLPYIGRRTPEHRYTESSPSAQVSFIVLLQYASA